MNRTKFVYTLSSKRNMVQSAMHSIKTLKNNVSGDNIVVFITPPIKISDIEVLNDLGVDVREVENETEGFSIRPTDEPSHYGEKIKLCTIDSENVVFLDCDTLVLGDIWEVIAGDFDFKARPGSAGVEQSSWTRLFNRYEKPIINWMPNAGFMIFKNRTHEKIEEEWKHFLNEDLEYSRSGYYHKEQYALALAVSEYNTQQMESHEHVMEWNDEKTPHGIVYHLQTQNTLNLSPLIEKAAVRVSEMASFARNW